MKRITRLLALTTIIMMSAAFAQYPNAFTLAATNAATTGDLGGCAGVRFSQASDSPIADSRGQEEVLRYPAWSPDGETLACAAILQSGEADLIAVSVKDGAEKPIGSKRWGRVMGAGWLANGKALIISATQMGSNSYQLWIVDSDGGNRRQLTFNSGVNVFPTVSADGRSIVFSSDRDGNLSLWRMDL